MNCLMLLKPDAFQRRLWGHLLSRMTDQTDFEIKRMELFLPGQETDEVVYAHYQEHEGKDFFDRLLRFMNSGPILAVGGIANSVNRMRNWTTNTRNGYEATNPANLLHCSDNAVKGIWECGLWFP